MSNPIFKFKVSSVDEDRFGWVRQAEFGQRKLSTPVFMSLIKGKTEFDTYIDFMNTYKVEHLGACIIPIIDAKSTTERKITKLKELKNQNRLFEGGLASNRLENFFEKTLVGIDPYTEYPFYEFDNTLLKMSLSLAIPESLRQLTSDIYKFKLDNKGDRKAILAYSERKYVKFYLDLKADPASRTAFVRDFVNSESARGASFGIPSGPLVIHKFKDEMFDVLKEFTRISKALWKGECLTYLPIEQKCLSDYEFMDKVSDYIEKEDSHFALKVKNFDLIRSDSLTRNSFMKFEERLKIFRKEKNKLAILFEAGPQAIPCSVFGFDMVSTSMRALDKDGAFGANESKGRGGYFDPTWLLIRRYKEIVQIFKSSGNKLPCSCAVCKSITDLDALTTEFWNTARRKHFLFTMNGLMTEFTLNIKEKRIDLSYDRIVKSELCPLKRIIPPH
jgi:hypothetical protein